MRYMTIIDNQRHMGGSFLKAWVSSLIILGGIIYPFLVICTLDYSDKLGNTDQYYRKKDAIAKSFGNVPKMLIVGGSSAFYGIDAVLMEKKLNIHVVNYGMHAGLGLEYPLKRSLRMLNNNDSLLLAFEGPLYTKESDQFSELLHQYVFSYDRAYLLDIGFKRAIQEFYGIPLRDFMDSWKIWIQTVIGKKPFSGQPKVFIDKRGGRLNPVDIWVRPMKEDTRTVGLKPYVEKFLEDFIHEAKKRNVKVFFTWPTVSKRADFLSQDTIIKGQELLHFLQAQGIEVIDNYTDHIYPLSFYTDTPYHLSRAGTHLRTEKLIKSLWPYFGQNYEPQNRTRFFLLHERHHKIEDFNYDGDDRYDFKVYANQSDSDDMLDDSGIQRAIELDHQVYFSDERLKRHLQEKYRIETARCEDRSLDADIKKYTNHIFFMMLNHVDEVASLNKDVLPKHFYHALSGKGYKTMVLGTGKYSDINIVKRDEKCCEMALNRNESIENSWLPFDLNMVSTKKPLSRFNVDRIAFFERDIYKPGLWMLVYDPDIGIIVDEFIYPDMTPRQSACLYRVMRKS
jgi:hypothetical protein